MYQFISNKSHRGLRMWDEKLGLVAAFINSGNYGSFSTKDEKIAEYLRKHKSHGKSYKEITDSHLPKFKNEEQVNYKVSEDGITPIVMQEEKVPEIKIEQPKIDVTKIMRFGELKGLLLKPNGEIKKTASKELIEEYNKLKSEV